MKINYDLLLNGCFVASLAHAIMTNVYPELSYEISWDRHNFSFNNSNGVRGTLTFNESVCIVAIRNTSAIAYNGHKILELISEFPVSIIEECKKETLEFLLVEEKEGVYPSVTSIFWCNDKEFYYPLELLNNIKCDLDFLHPFLMSKKDSIVFWRNYYEMDANSLKLLNYLLAKKHNDFSKKVFLEQDYLNLIPGKHINKECVIAFEEMNIFLETQWDGNTENGSAF